MRSRDILFSLFILFSFLSFGQQKLDGTFCNYGGFSGYCVTFKSGGVFEFSAWDCMTSDEGTGKYIIDKQFLTLYFDGDTSNNIIQIREVECDQKDSVFLRMVVSNKNTNDEVHGIVYLTGPSEFSKKFSINAGEVMFKIKSYNTEFFIDVFVFGFKQSSIKIIPNTCKDIQIGLTPTANDNIEDGTIWEFKIKSVLTDKLILEKEGFKHVFFKVK